MYINHSCFSFLQRKLKDHDNNLKSLLFISLYILINSKIRMPAPLLSSYSKTMAYLRTSHETPGTKDFFDFLGNESVDETAEFDEALANEVNKFNKLKRQKQVIIEQTTYIYLRCF